MPNSRHQPQQISYQNLELRLKEEGWQGHISFKKASFAKDTTLMGFLWPFGSLITPVDNLDRDQWLPAVRCL